ncbi:MAG: FecR family protein [Flavobacteriales bacterium]|nr:FecR family protein [Flavobacteriales bacterium]
MDNPTLYNLLVRYVDGETSASENRIVEDLLKKSEEWQNEYQFLIRINGKIEDSYKTNSQTAAQWDDLLTKINRSPSKPSKYHFRNWMPYAAAAVIVLLAGIYFLKPTSDNSAFVNGSEYKTGPNEVLYIDLPDGSSIALSESSELTLDKNFNQKSRYLKLKGEAFFQVAKKSGLPFVTYTDQTQTKVTGTSFLLNNTFGSDHILLELYEGKVEFKAFGQTESLDKNHKLVLNKKDRSIKKYALDHQKEEWTYTGLDFKDETLKQILSKLGKVNNVEFEVNEAKGSQKYTLSLNGMNLDKSLQLIEQLTDSKITKKGSKYVVMP